MAASTEHMGAVHTDTQLIADPAGASEITKKSDLSSELNTHDQYNDDEQPDDEEDNDDDDEPPGPKIRDTPEDIKLEAIANTVAFHPHRDMVVCGDVDGDVYAYSYSCTEGENRELWSSGHHMKSCRQVRFSADGLKLYSVSRDKAVHLLDTERGQLVTRIRGAHDVPINSLLLVDENILATGDDGGTVKVSDYFSPFCLYIENNKLIEARNGIC